MDLQHFKPDPRGISLHLVPRLRHLGLAADFQVTLSVLGGLPLDNTVGEIAETARTRRSVGLVLATLWTASPIVIWLLSLIIITLGGVYYSTYGKCIADARLISLTYTANKYEILYRQNRIVDLIKGIMTVADLRKALDAKIYFDLDLKDKTMSELFSKYRAASLRIEKSDVNQTVERSLMSSALSARFNSVLLGGVPDSLSDSDLPLLKQFATLIEYANFMTFLDGGKIDYEPECTPSVVTQIALGKRPVLLRPVQFSFLEREKEFERRDLLRKDLP